MDFRWKSARQGLLARLPGGIPPTPEERAGLDALELAEPFAAGYDREDLALLMGRFALRRAA